MNAIVQTALNKLIQDETFRLELSGMLDEVNRASTELVSREKEDDKERAEPAPDPAPVSKFSDVKEELLGDPTFLKALIDALMTASAPAEQERAILSTKLQESIDTLTRTVNELGTTINEHDKVIVEMAEKALIQEGEKSQTLRARVQDPIDEKIDPAPSKLADRAAKVLIRMEAKNAS